MWFSITITSSSFLASSCRCPIRCKKSVWRTVSVGVGNQKLSALGPNGVIKGLEKERQAFSIVRSSGENIDLLMYFFKICRAWEDLFENDPTFETLPSTVIFYSQLLRKFRPAFRGCTGKRSLPNQAGRGLMNALSMQQRVRGKNHEQ